MATFGAHIDSELGKVEGKTADEIEAKQKRVIERYLGENPSKGRFADPALILQAQAGG